jgi:hypothetical protein
MSAAPGTDTRPLDVIHELLATTAGVEKLGARAISIEEAQQVLDNRYVILRNPGRRRRRGQRPARRLVIGRTDGVER